MKINQTLWAALALATAGVTGAVAGPVTVPNELEVSQSAQSETESGGDVYEIGYTLSVSVGSESSLSLGVIGNFADYSNTGGLILQELSAANAPVPGNPDILFASGFDYTDLDEPVPEAPAWTAGLAGLGASLSWDGAHPRSVTR